MKTLKLAAILALFILMISCKQDHCKTNNQEATPIRITLLGINFTLNKFSYSGSDTIDSWYYPYEVVFLYEVSNNSSKDVILVINDTLANNNYYYQGIIRYKNSPVLCEKTIRIEKGNSRLFNCYILDLPIFDSIYCRKEFTGFIKDFRDNLYNELNIIRKGKMLTEEDIISIYTDDKFYFHFNHWKENSIKLKKIGFPIKKVPDSIVITKPIPGVEW